jgi:DNA polymerase-3 subunit epsilon
MALGTQPPASSSWVAIDFEIATASRASACSLAAVEVNRGEIARTASWLIRPPGNDYDAFNTHLHGIGPADTATAPAFDVVWQELVDLLAGRVAVAHYTGFDFSVIRAECHEREIAVADIRYACTIALGRRCWPGLPSYSLPWICDHLGLPDFRHHRAAADAMACAEVGLRLLSDLSVDTVEEAADRLEVRLGLLGADDVRCGAKYGKPRFVDPNLDADPEHPFYGACLAFTGALGHYTRQQAAVLAAERGAMVRPTTTRKTDYLVTGVQNPYVLKEDGLSEKMRRAVEFAKEGTGIQILTESEFFQML